MDSSNLASGDSSNSMSPRFEGGIIEVHTISGDDPELIENKITPQQIDETEIKMKERIAECKHIIESLKLQLNEEKEKQKKYEIAKPTVSYKASSVSTDDVISIEDYGNSSMYSASVDSKLCCDENLIEYEKQLQKYQYTLNIAQNEKKNAIRKQMLAKAFKLKLLEVENQCNIELLRVKQSLQCLEPLQIIASKWKTGASEENIYDIDNFELMPNYPEISAHSGTDLDYYKDVDLKLLDEACEIVSKDDSARSDT